MKLSQVYRYGLLDPTAESDRISEQIKLAHQYRNKLVEIERAFRAATKAAIDCQELLNLDAQIKGAGKENKAALWAQRREAQRQRMKQPEVMVAIDAAKQAKYGAIREARKTCGVFWGTYLVIEQAAEAAAGGMEEPKFQRWDGSGAVAVQLQGGLSAEDLLAAGDTRAQISVVPQPVPNRGGKPLPRVRLRIGSEGREPIWGEWPLIYHRPIPPGSVIKWMKVIRSKTASRTIWSLHVTIEREIEETKPDTERVLALDLRWKGDELNGEVTRRAGEWTDGKEKGIIMLDPAVVGALRKVEDLRSIRDQNQNEMHAKILDWAKKDDLPEAHKERMAHIAQWKSPGRFAGLAIWWRENRIEGDSEAFDRLEAWRKHDKHLWLWEASARAKALRRRKDQYRVAAARLVKDHDALVVEKLTLNRLAQLPADDDPGQHKARGQRVDTAPSELRMAFLNAFRREGKPVYEVRPGPLTTVWQEWCERRGDEKKAGGARSKRFNRLRGIVADSKPVPVQTA